MPAGLQRGLIAVLAVAAAIAVVAVVRTALKERRAIPVLVLVGTLLCVVYEPIGDRMVLAYYPEQGQITWVTLFDRGIPLFIGLMYLAYIPPFFLVFEALRRRGFTARTWWALWAGSILAIEVIELAVMRFGSAWVYYGPQRTVIADLPVWTPFTYVSFLFVIAAGVQTLATRLPARWHWTIVPAVPSLLAVAHMTASLPGALALYRTEDPSLILAGAVASMITATLIAAALARWFLIATGGAATPCRGSSATGGARAPGQTEDQGWRTVAS